MNQVLVSYGYEFRFPHPVTLSGILEMSRMFLPINSNWTRFIHEAERTYESINSDIQHTLMQIANEACRQVIDQKYEAYMKNCCFFSFFEFYFYQI